MPYIGRSVPAPRLPAIVLIILAVTFAGMAAAQPLVSLAPADTVLAFRYAAGGSAYPDLERDLRALDTEALGSTLRQTLEALQEKANGDDATSIGLILDLLEGRRGPLAALADVCPALGDADLRLPEPSEAVFTLSVSPFAPIPTALLVARVAPDDVAVATAIQDDLIDCFGDDATLDQDGVPLFVLGNGSDQPVTVARSGNLFVAASQIDAVRGALRRAGGSQEPSLATTALGSSPALSGTGFGAALQLAALADVVESMAAMAGPDAAPAVQRLTRALRTVPYIAARVEARPEGFVSEAWLRVDDDGGDAALARLLRCDGCRVRPNLLVPADAIGVTAMPLRLRDWTDYLIDLGEDIAASLGHAVDLRQALRDETGLDLEADLFSWLGERIDIITLPPVPGNLAGLLGQPARAVLIPIASPQDAKAGIRRLVEAARPLFGEIERSMSRDLEISVDGVVSVRSTEHTGIEVTRIQYGPTTDVGVAYLGNHLVIASPAAAIGLVIDTYQGGPTIFDNAAFRDVLQQSPDDVRSFSLMDEAAALRSVQPLLAAAAQPLAFGLQAVLTEEDLASVPFATLLQAADLPAEFVSVVADHLGVSRAWTMTTDDGVYYYSLSPLH